MIPFSILSGALAGMKSQRMKEKNESCKKKIDILERGDVYVSSQPSCFPSVEIGLEVVRLRGHYIGHYCVNPEVHLAMMLNAIAIEQQIE